MTRPLRTVFDLRRRNSTRLRPQERFQRALKFIKTRQQIAICPVGHSLQQGLESPIHLQWSYGMDPTVSATPEDVLDTTSLALVAEISHRVLNEYTHAVATLLLAAADTANADARLALKMAARRLRACADVHRALAPPYGPGRADLGEYLKTLCAALSGPSDEPVAAPRGGAIECVAGVSISAVGGLS
jgi:two-component sensor histidine kinase